MIGFLVGSWEGAAVCVVLLVAFTICFCVYAIKHKTPEDYEEIKMKEQNQRDLGMARISADRDAVIEKYKNSILVPPKA